MTSDDQYFLDVLSSISSSVRKFTATTVGQVFETTDRAADAVVVSLKDAARTAGPWLGLRRRPEPPPPSLPPSFFDRSLSWLSRHRALTAAVLAFLGSGAAYVYIARRAQRRKRRARRAASGARCEVVVVAGPMGSPVVKSMALDLERRGFVVYVLVAKPEEEDSVLAEARPDMRPFCMDVVDPLDTQQAMERLNNLLLSQHQAFAGAEPHNLEFTGLIIAPDIQYPSGPIETLPLDLWQEALNAKVLGTMATAQAFLPTICEHQARLLVLTPNIVSSLRPAFHGIENAVVGALDGFTTTLQRELSSLGASVVHLKLGTFDVVGGAARNHSSSLSAAHPFTWPPSALTLYVQNFLNQGRNADSGGGAGAAKGSPLRELHHAVFDTLTQPRPPRVWRVGRGSVAYDVIGAWVPAGLVGWMLGSRRVSLEEMAGPPRLEEALPPSWEKVEKSLSLDVKP